MIQEGIRAGAFAATGVAAWFFFADLLEDDAFFTPAVFGRGVATLLGVRTVDSELFAIGGYTVLHYTAFAALGCALVAVLRTARRDARALAGALLVFAGAELAFAGVVALLGATTMVGAVTWPQITAGNVVGCVLLGAWLWHRAPEIRGTAAAGRRGTQA